jgi:hypothetical protein
VGLTFGFQSAWNGKASRHCFSPFFFGVKLGEVKPGTEIQVGGFSQSVIVGAHLKSTQLSKTSISLSWHLFR